MVDIQNDFLAGGALEVQNSDAIVGLANAMQDCFDCVIATQDWHPSDHASFAENHAKSPGQVIELDGLEQILWPVHCVQNTYGAAFSKNLKNDRIEKIFYKGTDSRVDSYSSFFDNARKKSTGLDDWLRQRGVEELFVCGLATDYCVKYSVLDALSLGWKVSVIEDACQAVNLEKSDGMRAIKEMQSKGATILKSSSLLVYA